jgi:hypothetical protein
MRASSFLRAYPRTACGEGDSPLLLRDHRSDGARRKRGQSPAVLGYALRGWESMFEIESEGYTRHDAERQRWAFGLPPGC